MSSTGLWLPSTATTVTCDDEAMDGISDRLRLEPHPEGGYYRETWVGAERMTTADGRVRGSASLIYFWLPAGESSAWHRVASDEIWLAHRGSVVLELGGDGAEPTPQSSRALGCDVATRSRRRSSCRPACGSAHCPATRTHS